MTNGSMCVVTRVALATLLFTAVALAGCMAAERGPSVARGEVGTSAADVSAATAECEAFACQP